MAKKSGLRPRTLSVGFGLFFLIVILGMAYFATGLKGVWYDANASRADYFAFLVVGAIFTVGIGAGAVLSQRSIDARIAKLEAAEVDEVVVVEETVPVPDPGPEEVPPPLVETASPDEAVDRDIDELLVSLSEMEQKADTTAEAAEEPAPPAVETRSARTVRSVVDTAKLERLRKARKSIGKYIAGPASASIVIVGVCGALLPGSDVMLQSYYQFNAFAVLTIAYSIGGLAAYVAATFYLLLRRA